MRLTRVLQYLNRLIALAVLLVAALVYWHAWRPLPQTTGELQAPISAGATITRDALGVPHIKAANPEDALFLQGYATAQDRLWQMEALRRFSAGELSEIIGPATIETDRQARRLRMRRLAEEHARTLPPEDRRWTAAYARGVNHFIDTHRGRLPVEFTILGFEPRTWTIADSLVIGLQMFRDLTTTWNTDLTRTAMFTGPNQQLARELFPPRTGLEFSPGSNAWALSGKHTASGKPILANDTHLEWGVPSTWHMVHMEAPGLNVSGFSLPGVPAVIMGHNDRIAWGVTNLHFDVQDLYAERMDTQTGQYLFRGQPMQARPERELIVVKGASPVGFENWVTQHGPLWEGSGGAALSLRWTGAERGTFQMPFVQINMARNWEDFRNGLRRFAGPGQNFAYADVDGNIGYHATGLLPVRGGYDGGLVLDGASGAQEWDGFVPFDELPHAFNPPDGRVITANQNPFPTDWKYAVSGDFDPGFRAQQIRALLSGKEGWKPEDMSVVQKDVYSAFMRDVAAAVVRAYDLKKPGDENMRDAVDLLRGWNGQMEKGTAAPMIASLAYQQLRIALVDRVGTKNVDYQSAVAYAVVDRLLRERGTRWFADWDHEILQALRRALEEGRRLQGRNVKKWDHGVFLALELKHPVISRIPYVGKWFDIGPEPMSGSSTSVKQTTRRLGPSMRLVADTSDWRKSLANVTVGESGHVLSSHFKDQWPSYWAGKGLPMRWGSEISGDVLRVVPTPEGHND